MLSRRLPSTSGLPSRPAAGVAIIGGGAAGMMAAATLVEEGPGAAVTLFERNRRLGAKVLISGGGRCNVTTGLSDVRDVLERYPRGARWLRHAMHSFPPDQVIDWFESHGVPLKTEADLRVFPVSDNGHDVVGAFEQVLADGGVAIRLRAPVQSVLHDGRFWVEVAGDERPAGPYDRLIITTGGSAFSHTGSAGDGFRFARALGHSVSPLAPSLGAYVLAEPWVRGLAGVSLADALLQVSQRSDSRLGPPAQPQRAGVPGTAFQSETPHDPAMGRGRSEHVPLATPARSPRGRRDGGVSVIRHRGAILFTHFGITGPAVFALCALAAFEPLETANPLLIRLALFPDLSAEQADALLRERFAAMPARGLANVLDTLLPRSLCPVLCELVDADPATPAARVPRAVRGQLAAVLTSLPLTAVGRRAGEEFVTAGGVSLDEVDPRTMQSKRIPGLYFAGEVLDVDGFTGGFNLQSAWATGRLAGMAAGNG